MSDELEVRLERMKTRRAAYFHELSENPEEDAWKKAAAWLKKKRFLKKDAPIRIFGRNNWPTQNREPYGYGFFIPLTPDIKITDSVLSRYIPGGLYAVTRCEGVENVHETWGKFWEWIKESEHHYIGGTKFVTIGYELGLEEIVNWYEAMVEGQMDKAIFDLWIPLFEE
jgi:DNA gyrase inhibitor GyrI